MISRRRVSASGSLMIACTACLMNSLLPIGQPTSTEPAAVTTLVPPRTSLAHSCTLNASSGGALCSGCSASCTASRSCANGPPESEPIVASSRKEGAGSSGNCCLKSRCTGSSASENSRGPTECCSSSSSYITHVTPDQSHLLHAVVHSSYLSNYSRCSNLINSPCTSQYMLTIACSIRTVSTATMLSHCCCPQWTVRPLVPYEPLTTSRIDECVPYDDLHIMLHRL
eukprot:9772-Heterococcus_DN1.PRE.3